MFRLIFSRLIWPVGSDVKGRHHRVHIHFDRPHKTPEVRGSSWPQWITSGELQTWTTFPLTHTSLRKPNHVTVSWVESSVFLARYLIMLMFIYCSNKSIIRKLNTQNDVTLHGARNRSPCIIKKLHAHAHCGFDEPFLQKLTFFEFSGFNKQCLNQKACVGWIHLSQNTRRDNWQAVVNMVENSLVLERATANLLTRCSAVLVRYLETQMDKN